MANGKSVLKGSSSVSGSTGSGSYIEVASGREALVQTAMVLWLVALVQAVAQSSAADWSGQ